MNEEPIRCTFIFNAKEYKRALYSYYFESSVKWWVLGFSILIVGLIFWFDLLPILTAKTPFLPLDFFLQEVLPFLFILFLFFFALPYMTIRTFRKRPICDKQVTYTFDPSGILCENSLSRSETKWEAVVRLRETKSGFIYFYAANMFFWLPKTGFDSPEAISRFRSLVKPLIKKCSVG